MYKKINILPILIVFLAIILILAFVLPFMWLLFFIIFPIVVFIAIGVYVLNRMQVFFVKNFDRTGKMRTSSFHRNPNGQQQTLESEVIDVEFKVDDDS